MRRMAETTAPDLGDLYRHEAARLWRNGAQDHSHGRLDEENLNGCAG